MKDSSDDTNYHMSNFSQHQTIEFPLHEILFPTQQNLWTSRKSQSETKPFLLAVPFHWPPCDKSVVRGRKLPPAEYPTWFESEWILDHPSFLLQQGYTWSLKEKFYIFIRYISYLYIHISCRYIFINQLQCIYGWYALDNFTDDLQP